MELQLSQSLLYQQERNALDYTVYSPQKETMQQNTKSNAQTVSVTFRYKYDPNDATPMSLTIYNPQQGVIAVDKTGKESSLTVQVPVGTYDMHAMFKGKPAGLYAVFKEGVEISKDMTVTFDKAEATVPFTFKVKDENGTPLTLDKYSGGAVAEKGNTNSFRSYSFFALKGMGVVHTIIGGAYRIKGYDVDFYVNKVSDRFVLLYACNMRSTINNHTYLYKFEAPLNVAATLESNPADLVCYKQKFVPTPAGEQQASAHIFGFRIWCTYDGKVLLSGKAENKNKILENRENTLFIDLPEPESRGFAVMVSPMMGDTYMEQNKQYKHIVGIPVTGNQTKGLRFVSYGYDILDGYVIPVGGGAATVYPGHPALSWVDRGEKYIYGNSCPILSVKAKDYDGKSTKMLTYLGRYGEIYETDKMVVKTSEKKEGEFVDYTFTLDNVKVDNISGRNVTVLHHKTSGTDITAPTIQMLRIVRPSDAESSHGVISDRLKDSGILEFVAADMQYCHNKTDASKRYYQCKPLKDVSAYISKHGEGLWTSLHVEEVPENFFMPGYGHFYRASLNEVQSDGDWFDLKLVLKDETGNKNTQTLSPAFFMGKHTGIVSPNKLGVRKIFYREGLLIARGATQITLYDMEGRVVMVTQGVSMDVSSLKKGIYVVKATMLEGKDLTQKIVL